MGRVKAVAVAVGGALALAAGIWVGLPFVAQTNQSTVLAAQPVVQESQPATVEQTGTGITTTGTITGASVSQIAAIVRPGGASLLDRPSGTVVEELQGGADLTLIGRMPDGAYYIVQRDEGPRFVAVSEVIAPGAENLAMGFGGAGGAGQGGFPGGGQGFPQGGQGAAMPLTGTVPIDGTGMVSGTFPGGGGGILIPPAQGDTGASATGASLMDADTTTTLATTAAEASTASTSGTGATVLNTLFNAANQDAMPKAITPAIVRSSGVTLDTAPGAGDGAMLGRGTMLNATGASEDGAYLQVETTSTPVETGWVALASVIYTGVPIGEKTGDENATATATTGADASEATIVVTTASTDETATEATTESVSDTTTEAASVPAASTGFGRLVVASGASRLNVRAAPGTANAIVGKGEPGASLTLLGKTADGAWLQAQTDDGVTGWVAASYVTGDTSAAPILDEPVTNAAPSTSTSSTAASAVTAGAAPDSVAAPGSSVTGLTGTIVYQTAPGGTFYAYDLETGAQWALTSGWDPSISPDGQTVAFVRGGGESGIWLIDIDGGNERLIYGERRDLSSPKWSPDGNYIVFGRGDSYITCRQVGRECLPDSVWLDRNPNMELDQFPLIDVYLQNLARIDIHGNNYRDIATLESAREPDWSTEGIVYASSDGLQLTNDTENAVNQVVYFEPLQARDQDPDWAGERIVFVTRQSSHYQIFAVNADGTGKVALTRPVTTLVDQIPSNVAPAFSPDGQHILFLSNRDDNNEAGTWRIWVMDADGGNQRQLPIDTTIEYDFNHMEQALSWGA